MLLQASSCLLFPKTLRNNIGPYAPRDDTVTIVLSCLKYFYGSLFPGLRLTLPTMTTVWLLPVATVFSSVISALVLYTQQRCSSALLLVSHTLCHFSPRPWLHLPGGLNHSLLSSPARWYLSFTTLPGVSFTR